MAEITASDVGKLREATGAGLMDCKKALVETNGSFAQIIVVRSLAGSCAERRKPLPS